MDNVDKNNIIAIETLVIGFGFSTIPLYRELDRTGEKYIIISDPDPKPIWETLRKGGNLDFDLVSSYHTSFYSFNIVKDFKTDYYTPAREYYDMHLEYYNQYKDKIIPDFVTKIENYKGYSLVYTRSGQTYKATNVVIATNFKRRILSPLATFDFKVKNKTIVFNMIGDSVNLMIAKLIAGNNRIIILSDGFVTLDKMFQHGSQTFTLDQLEYHNVAKYAPRLYNSIIIGDPIWRTVTKLRSLKESGYKFAGWLEKFYLTLGKIFNGNSFAIAHDNTMRTYNIELERRKELLPVVNGFIVIKYWPIDTYESMFGNDIQKNIEKGFLLNDLPFFIDQGVVECYRKTETVVDKENKTITHDGKTINYDFFVEGDSEFPNLPEIIIKHPNGKDEEYKYVHRNNYFGTIPKDLSNIFHIGVTRPTTGGLGNLTEMQALLIHKTIANDQFKKEIYGNLGERIEKYNASHYASSKVAPSDHLVYYGFYTEEIATVLGINTKLSDCRSVRDVMKYLFFPNNAFKFRQTGEYKVEGCDKLVDFIYDTHKGFYIIPIWIFAYCMYLASFAAFIIKSYWVGYIGLPAVICALVALYFFKSIVSYAAFYAYPLYITAFTFVRLSYLIVCFVATLSLNPLIFIPLMGIDILTTFIIRQLSPLKARMVFNDLKIKRKYSKFFKKYQEKFREVRLKE